ncbi:MAG: hypothetical protein RBG1_1C00001G1552 [candidate division Zixibacteria bacterium RBG-1]|nr:MAG: hypothetical protein RBG1_1C00001G1552 [candidate division Zixibacteria bacterium RBG-1]OGC84965.1 MAG: hypothetical protein A2V73_03090 [candidate division Zixibacteria bacterium RBG_19FT_COMBO_42_43]
MKNFCRVILTLALSLILLEISNASDKNVPDSGKIFQTDFRQQLDCGTYPGIEKDIMAQHLKAKPFLRPKVTAFQTRDIGNIAILEDDGTLIFEPSWGLTIDDAAVASAFYQTHPDSFDFITMFRNFDAYMFGFAYHFQIQNQVQGVGLPFFDDTPFYGSAGRLQGFSNQNDINYQVDDPHFHMYRIHSTMSGMLHETMHQWAAFLNNPNQLVNQSHWYSFSDTKSNYGDSTTSAMEGYMWTDLGGGDYQGYAYGDGLSPLDLYVMGLNDTSQVPDRWYLADPFVLSPTDIVVPPYYALPVDLRVNGTPQTLSIQDIVADNGLRTPTPTGSQKAFNMAIILVVKNGEVPKGDEIARIEKIRKEFEDYFYVSTGGLATMNTSLYGSNTMELVSKELRGAAIGYSYSENVYAVGGTEPYSWTLQGTLPSGLSFNTSGGIISGTPGELGSFQLKFKVQDSGSQEDSVDLVLTVSDTGSSSIVINELELWERYNVGAGIELYNKGNKAADLSNWVLEMNGVNGRIVYSVPSGVVLPPQNYLVLLESSGINTSRRLFIGQDIAWIYNGRGFCALKDDNGNGVDFVRFGNSFEPPPAGTSWSGTNPVILGAYHNLVRDSLSTDTDKSRDFVECNGNLGRKNLCAKVLNIAPILDGIGAKAVSEGSNLTFRVHAFDSNGDGIILKAENFPANSNFFDSGNGAGSFSFSPDTTQAGVYNVRFMASDGELNDTLMVQITVANCTAKAGDTNANNQINLGDIVYLVNFVFKGGAAPSPVCRGDANGSGGALSLPDIIYLVNFVFKGTAAPVKSDVCCL